MSVWEKTIAHWSTRKVPCKAITGFVPLNS